METKHVLKTGGEIAIEISKFCGATILRLRVNFNPYEHASLGYVNITSIPGIKTITGIQASGKNFGQFSYLLKSNANVTELKNDIIEQISNYFIKF